VRCPVPPDRPALPAGLRGPIGVVAVLSGLLVAVLAARYAGDATAGPLDRWVESALGGLLPEHGQQGAYLVELAGEPVSVVVLAGLLAAVCLATRRRRLAVVAVAGPGATGLVTTLLKPVTGRTIDGGNGAGPTLAYPSGHTAAVTALAFVGALLVVDLLRARRLPALLVVVTGAGAAGAVMALTLVGLDIHYPTDTVGGFFTAMAVVPATALLVDRIAGRRRRPG
jgi:membrane-associated phospholipid phosphatase